MGIPMEQMYRQRKDFVIVALTGITGSGCSDLAEDVKAGDVVTEKNVRSVRPRYGLHPKYLPEVLGKKFVKDCEKGERFELEMVIG